jgi:hypothetical protein
VSGKSHHWRVTGAGSIYHVDRTGFRIYLDNAQSSAFALENDWRVSYIAHSAPVPCLMSEWQDWSTCSRSCNNGTMSRVRIVLRKPYFGGVCLEPLAESRACNTEHCPAEDVAVKLQVKTPCFDTAQFESEVESRLGWVPVGLADFSISFEYINLAEGVSTGVQLGAGPSGSVREAVYETDEENPAKYANIHLHVSTDFQPQLCELLAAVAERDCVIGSHIIGGLTCRDTDYKHCTVSDWADWSQCSQSCDLDGVQTRGRTVVQKWEGVGAHCPPLAQAQTCNYGPCPVNCDTSEWSGWGPCCRSCGGATQLRTRSVIMSPLHGGFVCPTLESQRQCNMQPCPIDCTVSGYGGWSACSATCSWGAKRRTQAITRLAKHGGMACPLTTDLKPCHNGFCPVGCTFSSWAEWGPCSKECKDATGSGSRSRTRTIVERSTAAGTICPATLESEECGWKPCFQNCTVGLWTGYDTCSKTCGGGEYTRTRLVIWTAAGGGAPCPALTQTHECNAQACPVNCVATPFTPWSQCIQVAAYSGRRLAVASAATFDPNAATAFDPNAATAFDPNAATAFDPNAATAFDPNAATAFDPNAAAVAATAAPTAAPTTACSPGDFRMAVVELCTPCPVGKYSTTYNAAACASCPQGQLSAGVVAATKCVEIPTAQPTDAPTKGPTGQPTTQAPTQAPTKAPTTVPTKAPTECDRQGMRWRMRQTEVAAAHGGDECGEPYQQEICDRGPCAVDCAVSAWSDYSACSVSCDGGTMARTRTVVQASVDQLEIAGAQCPTLEETTECNTMRCAVDCVVSAYAPCSDCSAPCMTEAAAATNSTPFETQTRTILRDVQWGGVVCPPLVLTHSCNAQPCTIDCDVTHWSAWEPPEGAAFDGMLARSRTVLTAAKYGGAPCPALSERKKWFCEDELKFVTVYGDWSACSKACNTGVRTREKKVKYCSRSAALNMKLAFRQSEKCNSRDCGPTEDATPHGPAWPVAVPAVGGAVPPSGAAAATTPPAVTYLAHTDGASAADVSAAAWTTDPAAAAVADAAHLDDHHLHTHDEAPVFDPNAATASDPNAAAAFDPNAAVNSDPNAAAAFDPNAATASDPNAAAAFDPNAATAFDPNAATASDPNAATAFDPNAATAFDPNAATAFDPNAATAFDPNAATAFDPSAATGFDPAMFDPNNMG